MALTKLPKAGLATGSVSTSQIEDGTIQNQEFEDGTLTSAKLADSTIANAKLSNSTITLNGTSIALGASGSFVDGELVEWQSVTTSNTTMVAGRGYFVNTTSGEITMTLPSSGTRGDTIAIKDYAGTFNSNKCIVARNGHNIQGEANDGHLDTIRQSVIYVYVDSTKGWLVTHQHDVGDLGGDFITATGGTVTTSGDYKYHTFNSSSNFVVSKIGSAGNPTAVGYIVTAGGGGGGHGTAGGGGAGGLRQSVPESLTITAQTYPITVGAGGATGAAPGNEGQVGNNGSNSIFSTITSAGGGGGGASYNLNGSTRPDASGVAGGSGGGGNGFYGPANGGAGNTPPVSPSQGNAGGGGNGPAPGPGPGTNVGSGGGGGAGGAGGAGANGSPTPGISSGAGGAGLDVSPNWSMAPNSGSVAGGGSGGLRLSVGTAGSVTHGGGAGGLLNNTGSNGTANTGGGAGGGGNNSAGGTGGSGFVIIKYKYQ